MNTLFTQRNFLGFIGFTAALSLGFALVCQYGFEVTPCQLCYYERYIYIAIAVIGLIGFYKEAWSVSLFKIIALALLIGTMLGIYHLGVELHWWQAPASCGGISRKPATIEEFRQLLKEKPIVPCNQVNWRIFGVSATIWNLVWFLGFGSLWLLVSLKTRRPNC